MSKDLELEQNEGSVRSAESSSWVILDVNQKGAISYVNSNFSADHPLKPQAWKGKRISDFCRKLFAESYIDEASKQLAEVFKGKRERCEFFVELSPSEVGQSLHFLVQAEVSRSNEERMVVVLTDITAHRMYSEKLFEAKRRSMRLVEYGNVIIIRTDPDFRITDVLGDSEKILGLPVSQLVMRGEVWTEFIDRDHFRLLRKRIRKMGKHPHELSAEIRVINRKTEESSWLLLHAVPLFTSAGEFLGWEGFGLDITEKRRTEVELRRERRRVQALLEVSKALQAQTDPAFVALRGLSALMRATSSDSGFVVFNSSDSDYLEIVAAAGLSQAYLDGIGKVMGKKNLMRYVIDAKEGLLLENIQKDTRAATKLATEEGLRGAIVMPLMFEERGVGLRVVGSLVLFSRQEGRYGVHDFDLVAAASSQIALVVRQAEFYMAERRQASSLATLYRLSHQLSRLFTPFEVAQSAFPLIQEEIACKRMWMGVINQQGTHLQGVGGVGPGVRQPIIDLQIELGLRHDFLDDALNKKQAIIVEEGQQMDCSGLNRLFEKLKPKMFVIVPLVSLGQVVGVLVVEPAVPSAQFLRRKLPLLSGMANEIATVLLARRLESKVSDAEKMRMAGLLASGVAHNFNNLLQAVMGQASLIEMQVPSASPLGKAAQTIIDAAGKGAGLIKHLLSLTQAEKVTMKTFQVNDMIKDSKEVYDSILSSDTELEVALTENAPLVYGDYGQLQQVITNLVQNAKEALVKSSAPKVKISTRSVHLKSGEVDRELAPGQYLRIDVEDNGIGMTNERRARCFEPFYTTKDADADTGIGFSGSGLGLSIGYSIIKQHHGLLMVQSQPGQGTTFCIYIPAHKTAELHTDDKARPKPLPTVPGELPFAVILDPKRFIDRSVTATLQSLNFNIKTEVDAEAAKEFLSEERDKVKLIIVDIDSEEFADERALLSLRDLARQATVIVATQNVEKWGARFKLQPGIEVLEKPLGVWAVHSTMRKVMYSESLSSQVERSIEPNGAKKESVKEKSQKTKGGPHGQKDPVH